MRTLIYPETNTIEHAPSAAVLSGALVVLGAGVIHAIAIADVAANAMGAFYIKGGFLLTSVSANTGVIGDLIYWDATNSRLTTTATANTLAGKLLAPKTNGQTVALVDLNG